MPVRPARELTFLRLNPTPGDLLEHQAGLLPHVVPLSSVNNM